MVDVPEINRHVAVLGEGGRESAFIHSLLQDSYVSAISVFDFHAGFSDDSRVIAAPMPIEDHRAVVKYCQDTNVDFVVSGPELVAANGLNDALRTADFPVFGASQTAIQIESDKAWARVFMEELNIPQPKFYIFTDATEAKRAASRDDHLRVVKATGLCSGKGVIVCDTLEETERAIDDMLIHKIFGAAGSTIVLEERLGHHDATAEEVSVMYYTDGKNLQQLPLVQDYKREFDQHRGANTGGMGCHTAPELLSSEEQTYIYREIAVPLLNSLADLDLFAGILYISIMKVAAGIFVIEINGRGGDPETIVQLAGQSHPHFSDFLLACATSRLAEVQPVTWDQKEYVDVVLCAREYPAGKSKGEKITGLSKAHEVAHRVLHAGTRLHKGEVVTHGGRILHVLGKGDTRAQAQTQAYDATKHIHFNGKKPKHRTDIGGRRQ